MTLEDASDPVGYKSPPQHSRFQKGRSGNPSGRRKAKPRMSLAEELDKLLGEPIQIARNGRTESISYVAALLRKTGEAALKGDARARQTMLDLIMQRDSAATDASQGLSDEQKEELIAAALLRMVRSQGSGHA